MSTTIAELLAQAQEALTFAQQRPCPDPQTAVAIQLAATAVSIVQRLHDEWIIGPREKVEVLDIGGVLLEHLARELAALGEKA